MLISLGVPYLGLSSSDLGCGYWQILSKGRCSRLGAVDINRRSWAHGAVSALGLPLIWSQVPLLFQTACLGVYAALLQFGADTVVIVIFSFGMHVPNTPWVFLWGHNLAGHIKSCHRQSRAKWIIDQWLWNQSATAELPLEAGIHLQSTLFWKGSIWLSTAQNDLFRTLLLRLLSICIMSSKGPCKLSSK